MVDDDNVFGTCCSSRTVYNNLSGCSSFCSLRVIFLSGQIDATVCHAPHSRVPLAHLLHLAQLKLFSSLSFTRSVSATLSLYAFILAYPAQSLSMIVLILSRHSLLCGLIALPCDASAACKMNMTLETLFISILKKAGTVKMRANVTTNLCTN